LLSWGRIRYAEDQQETLRAGAARALVQPLADLYAQPLDQYFRRLLGTLLSYQRF
jgi:hypothetical protein